MNPITIKQKKSSRTWLPTVHLFLARSSRENFLASGGFPSPTNGGLYCYAGNNPVRYVDPDGREVFNKTNNYLIIKPENSKDPYVILKPFEYYYGNQDGILCPNGTTLKCAGRANVSVEKLNEGDFYFSGNELLDFIGNKVKEYIMKNPQRKRDEDFYGVYKYEGSKTNKSGAFLHSWWEGEKEIDTNIDKKPDANSEIIPNDIFSIKNVENLWKVLKEKNKDEI